MSVVLSVVFYLLQVDYFGISRTAECYFVSLSLVAFLLSLTQVGHLSSIFLPIYHSQEKDHGTEAANRCFWVIVNWLLVISVVAIALSFFLSDVLVSLIAPGFDDASQELITRLFQVLSFSIILQLLNIKLSVLFNALNIFNRTEIQNLVKVLIGILTLYFGYEQLGIWALLLGIYLGHFVTLFFYTRLLYTRGIQYQFIFSTQFFNHKQFFRNLLYIYPYIFSKRLYDFVLTASVSFLPQGVYAIYKYIESIFLKTGGIILAPTTNIFFTNYSLSNADQAKRMLQKAFKINLIISLFTILVVWSFGNDIIQFFWYQKIASHFNYLAYLILLMSFISLLFVAIGGLCFKILFVKQKTKKLYFIWALSFLLLSIYATTVIYFLKEEGLVSVILVNAILNNCLFFFLVYQEDKSVMELLNRSFLIKLVSIFCTSLLLGYGIDQLNFSFGITGRLYFLIELIIKTILLTIGIGILSFLFKIKTNK